VYQWQGLIALMKQRDSPGTRSERCATVIPTKNSYDKHTDICVGEKVAISNVNFLPEIGLYNRAIGDVIEIVYNDRPVGTNDKQHYHLPIYVVVNFPNLRLSTNIAPWDELHKTVSST
jgi:hypothetical protein